LGERVISFLQAAGTNGAAVTDIASALSVPAANLHVWFSTTGKKNSAIRKEGRGTYVWKEPVAEVAWTPEPEPTPEVPAAELAAEESVEPAAAAATAAPSGAAIEPLEPAPEPAALVEEPAAEEPAEFPAPEVVAAGSPENPASVTLDLFETTSVEVIADDTPAIENPTPEEAVRE
jgi:hypothetical protein